MIHVFFVETSVISVAYSFPDFFPDKLFRTFFFQYLWTSLFLQLLLNSAEK